MPTKEEQVAVMTVVKNRLNEKYEFRYNLILDRIEYKANNPKSVFKEVDEQFINSEWVLLMEDKIGFNTVSVKNLLNSDFSKPYHPFRYYFENLPKWDRKDYIKELCKTVETTTNDLWDYYFKKWIVAMVACAVNDDIVNHTALVFSGGQGVGKTTWLNKLVPNELKEYRFVGTIIPGDKDSLAVVSDCILINLDEFEALPSPVQSKLKSIITLDSTRQRRPYKEKSKVEIRRASFCASVNNSDFLNDASGSRRFLCFETTKIDFTHKIDMDKVFTQAYRLYLTGFEYHLNNSDIEELNKHNEKFKKVSDEEEFLRQYIRKPEPAEIGLKKTTTEILQYIAMISNKDILAPGFTVKCGKALSSLGFESGKSNGTKYYKVIFIDLD